MSTPEPFPPDIARWLKSNPRADWMCHAAGSLHPHHPRWYGTPESAVEAAQAGGFESAWAEREGFTWLYLRQAQDNES